MSKHDDAIGNSRAHWHIIRWIFWCFIRNAAQRVLMDRSLRNRTGREIRWLRTDIDLFLSQVSARTAHLRPLARLDALPNFGSRLMVELAIYTVAADQALRDSDLDPQSARDALADIGWSVYRRQLAFSSLPSRLVTRDPGKRLRWSIRGLLLFPFRPVGAPGYAAEVIREGEDIHTHFTHCPPQSFARRIAEEAGDPEALAGFANSWCKYDWPGADLIAADGHRGHYIRRQTLSAGDPVCDMCWAARAPGETSENNNEAGQ
ncbi:MAG: L-2-amino-thiazoline-4-carboxylic acid hydrolase [Hoeflea sp.]|uniref:hypothetical protein n=1 Tax=Hoeflea sp. TaxID=1940281 RepID=UPI001D84D291|nr:hypothetical protein [Hoeflea sp.]MBU4529296.1 L-2-amino-thiazoline-4-carboxylic acid hydrolase [Alphaproteobacteria bacterium]MBU4545463.1 L-2-amino-thiazoline-4-carboxylic acid hydrolase [Alphaproteobacteria bacterium]MBU4550178.1 L-2-amino-thiazoline-4-carboxylic acid hydrolase [Alphaproteobacteria bacterium]MBV1723219.1 L-2-amino-thiazoline-4-carboxylic acid hydrolase [Hoeflea sp.]MBV1782892.1 L-2-amino-thiazoline-4-carboxylic acid hydrolase [Hoeflea sp.]